MASLLCVLRLSDSILDSRTGNTLRRAIRRKMGGDREKARRRGYLKSQDFVLAGCCVEDRCSCCTGIGKTSSYNPRSRGARLVDRRNESAARFKGEAGEPLHPIASRP